MSEAERTDSELYDTVVGYRGGNWIYEWSKQAMLWQQKASQKRTPRAAASTGCMRPISTPLPRIHI